MCINVICLLFQLLYMVGYLDVCWRCVVYSFVAVECGAVQGDGFNPIDLETRQFLFAIAVTAL